MLSVCLSKCRSCVTNSRIRGLEATRYIIGDIGSAAKLDKCRIADEEDATLNYISRSLALAGLPARTLLGKSERDITRSATLYMHRFSRFSRDDAHRVQSFTAWQCIRDLCSCKRYINDPKATLMKVALWHELIPLDTARLSSMPQYTPNTPQKERVILGLMTYGNRSILPSSTQHTRLGLSPFLPWFSAANVTSNKFRTRSHCWYQNPRAG